MFANPNRPPRPRLTGPILLYAVLDIAGLTVLSLGGSWFIAGKGAIISGFPASLAEAVVCTAGGLLLMFWAVARLLREIMKQGPEMQARYGRYIASQHPPPERPAEHTPPSA